MHAFIYFWLVNKAKCIYLWPHFNIYANALHRGADRQAILYT